MEEPFTRAQHQLNCDDARRHYQEKFPNGFVQAVRWVAGTWYDVTVYIDGNVLSTNYHWNPEMG